MSFVLQFFHNFFYLCFYLNNGLLLYFGDSQSAFCRYGEDFVSGTARKYFKKVKNAQEAHEAIRPTDISRLPCKISNFFGLHDTFMF